jgi:Ca2+-binding EF-hand superfamily protein
LTDLEGAKAVARRIFDTYDKNRKGVIAQFDTVPMIVEAYKSFNQYFSPSSSDISSYFRVLDRNGDGQVTYSDIEELCIRYLCPQYSTVKEAPKKAKYTPEVEQRLDVARRLFKKFDKDNTGVLDSDEVKGLIGETYAQMGM